MLKMTMIAGAALVLGFTAAQAHDSYGRGYSAPVATVQASVGSLLGVNANVGSQRGGLLNLNANVGQGRDSLLDLNANVGGRNGLADVHANVGGCNYCGGVGHW